LGCDGERRIVPPGVDLAVGDLEGPHDLQLERLVREPEDVHPLGHHDRTIGRDVDDAELDALDARRARADERVDRVGDGLPASDRRLPAQKLRTTSIGLSIWLLLR